MITIIDILVIFVYGAILTVYSWILTDELCANYHTSENVVISNPHPLGYDIGDCAVRAISHLLDIDWDEAYDLLVRKGRENFVSMNNRYSSSEVAYDHGYRYEATITSAWNEHLTFEQFIRLHDHGKYLLYSPSHIVAVKDGKIYDTYDSHAFSPNYVVYGVDNADEFEKDPHIEVMHYKRKTDACLIRHENDDEDDASNEH